MCTRAQAQANSLSSSAFVADFAADSGITTVTGVSVVQISGEPVDSGGGGGLGTAALVGIGVAGAAVLACAVAAVYYFTCGAGGSGGSFKPHASTGAGNATGGGKRRSGGRGRGRRRGGDGDDNAMELPTRTSGKRPADSGAGPESPTTTMNPLQAAGKQL